MSPAPPQVPGEPPSAFTVLEHEHEHEPRARHVLAVRPQRREPAPAPPGPGPDPLDPKFTRALDFKLRRLKDKELLQANLRRPVRPRRAPPAGAEPEPRPAGAGVPAAGRLEPRRGRSEAEGERPRFVTTVKTGQFLLPPPPLASLLGLEALYPAPERNLVYSYASRPQEVPRARRAAPPTCAGPEAPVPWPGHGAGQCAGPGGARHVFGGVRALVAGVVGMRHMLDDKHEYAPLYFFSLPSLTFFSQLRISRHFLMSPPIRLRANATHRSIRKPQTFHPSTYRSRIVTPLDTSSRWR